MEKGEFDTAIANQRKAVWIKPDYAWAHYNLGLALHESEDFYGALESFKQALHFAPYTVEFLSSLGISLKENGSIDAAIENYRKALQVQPDHVDPNWNLSPALLQSEQFEPGWSGYEWRWKGVENFEHPLRASGPIWQPGGKYRVLLWGEQGLNDMLIFASLISELQAVSSKLIVQIDACLIALFQRSFSDCIEFHAPDVMISKDQYDVHIPMGSLPQNFRKTTQSYTAAAAGWLSADMDIAFYLRSKYLGQDAQTLIGISWHSTAIAFGALKRILPLEQLAHALHAPHVRLISLQYGPVDDEIGRLNRDCGIEVVCATEIDNQNDLDGLAALIMAYDKVVSIDNSTVHLAGALGKETHVLLPYSCDWRWEQTRSDSYWYAALRLCRQRKLGQWSDVLEGLKETALLGCEQSKPLPLLISSQPSKQLTELVSDLYNQGQFEEVISSVDTLLVTYPDAFWLLNSQGGARHAPKAYDKAI